MKNLSFIRIFVLGLICVFSVSGALHAREKLILFGGGNHTPEGVAKFAEWAGGKEGRILVLAWATASPAETVEDTKVMFAPYQPEKVERGLAYDDPGFDLNTLLSQIDSATGVFFPGGDQVDLMDRINKHIEIRESLLKKYHEGIVFGGYSAGTAIASKTMLTGNGDDTGINPKNIETAEGLGLIENFVVDQHFIARKRQNRLISVLQKTRESVGIGIDEDMALVLEDGKNGLVLGNSFVTLLCRKQLPTHFEMILLTNGQRVTLP